MRIKRSVWTILQWWLVLLIGLFYIGLILGLTILRFQPAEENANALVQQEINNIWPLLLFISAVISVAIMEANRRRLNRPWDLDPPIPKYRRDS
ncbi:MAG: hypothetical protein AAB520_04225 [Patescibacteria group bacterium]